jgi:putative nucleotidyltransferase with HDIG domain
MYIHKLGGPWIKHPFIRSSFLLEDKNDIKRIHQAGIKELWIDEAKGLSRVQQAVPEMVSEELADATPAAVSKEEIPKSMEAEVDRARKFCSAAKEQVKLMYDDVRLGKAIDSTIIMPLIGEIDSMVQSNSSAILSVARLKTHDDYTYMHSVAVCALMLSLAHQLNLDEEQTRLAGIGGLMHDLGKAFMSVDILNKPGKLTDAEFISVRKHPEAGAKVLEDNGAEPEVIDIALHHHEKVNGSGYPHGLLGEEISFLSRMGAICDVYDAVTSLRAYKKPWDPSNAIRTMAQWDGHFDKNIFNAFVKTVGIYPVGSLVRLSSKRLAVVIEPGKESLLKPKIKVFFSLGANAHIPVQTIDLAATTCNVTIEGPEDPETWGFKSLDDLWQ